MIRGSQQSGWMSSPWHSAHRRETSRGQQEPVPPGPKQKWGPALLPAPTAPSEGSAGVRDLISRSFTVLDPGSPAQASLPIVVVSRRTRSRPSAALLGSIPFRVCFSPEGSAFATEGSTLPAPLASWSRIRFAASSPFRAVLPQFSFHRLPAEIGALEPALPREDGAAAPITV